MSSYVLTDALKNDIREAGKRSYPNGINPWKRGRPEYRIWREGFKLAAKKAANKK